MKRRALCTIVPLLLTAATPWAAPSKTAPVRDAGVDPLVAAHAFPQVAISPDGKQVAWVEKLPGDGGPAKKTSDAPSAKLSAIYLTDINTARVPVRITAGNGRSSHAEGGIAWSPDSRTLAFLSDAGNPGQRQIFIAAATGGRARKVTAVKGFLATPGWSPDGKTIAVLFTENATRDAGPLVAATIQTGEIKDAVTEQRLAVIDVAAATLRQITPPDMYIYEYAWSPDGTRFAATAAHGSGDDNWYIAQLYAIDAATGAMTSLHKPPLQIGGPTWSPDGRTIAFIAGLMSDEPSVGGDVFAVAADGGAVRNLTPDMKATASWLSWTATGKILVGQYLDGGSALAALNPADRKLEILWRGPAQLSAGGNGSNVSLARDGATSAVVRSGFGEPPEVWAGPIGAWRPITKRNAGLTPAWGEAKSLHWKSDGHDVQGWLLYPRDFDPAKKYPMVVRVHGGPSGSAQPGWPSAAGYQFALAAAGYFVLQPNPRGSYGRGEAFTRANMKDFGHGDLRDILAGVDEAIRTAPIDPNRLGVCGWSYGGFMTMWAVTQTHRFKAAMAGAGIANWQSYYGQNQINQWMIPFFGASVHDDPAVYAKSSPINFIKRVKTPTLIIVGDADAECPAPQSYEFWRALKTMGIETRLVVYEREGHVFSRPEHQRDMVKRTVDWFDAHLR